MPLINPSWLSRKNLLVVKVLDVPRQNFGMIDDLSALRTRILAAAVVVDQVLLVVLRLHKFAAGLTNLF